MHRARNRNQDPIGLDLIRLSVQQNNKNWDPYDRQAEKLTDKNLRKRFFSSSDDRVSRQAQ